MKPTLNLLLSIQGGQGRDVLDAALATNTHHIRLFNLGPAADFPMGELLPLDQLVATEGEDYFIGARRDQEVKSLIASRLSNITLTRIIHPKASVSPYASLGENTFVGALAVINPQARLGNFVFVNAGCILDHDCVVGDGTSLGPGVTFPGFVTIGENCSIGVGVVAKPGVTVAAGSTVGAGAVIVNDLNEPGVYVGNPAKLLRR